MTTSAQATTAAAIEGPLPLLDLAALLRASAFVCGGTEGRDHDILTATDIVRDRVATTERFWARQQPAERQRDVFAELVGIDLSDGARRQAAAALCRAVYGRVPAEPVVAALRWQDSIETEPAQMLKQMLETAAYQVAIEAANARAAALLGVDEAVLDVVDERA